MQSILLGKTMEIKTYYIYTFVFVTLGFLISGTICAKEEGNCILKDENNKTISSYDWKYGIDLNAIDDVQKKGTIVHSYWSKNIFVITNRYNNDIEMKHYVSIDLENYDYDHVSNFVIRIGDEFENYEREQTSTTLKLRVKFLCYNEKFKEIEFRIPIKDSNNHSPEFLDESYNFTLPMPVPKAIFTEKIMLRDFDLTNKHITLNFDENERSTGRFHISSAVQDQKNKKNYLAQLISSTTIDLEDDISFVLSATDSGNPPRTTNTIVNIVVDKENSYPRFARQLYTANLTKIDYKKADKILVEFAEGNVTITRGYQSINNITIRGCSDDNEKHFKLIQNGVLSEHGLVTYIELNNLTEDFLRQKVISVVLAAIRSHVETTTVLQILLPEISDDEVPNRECQISRNAVIANDDSTNGYMVATIVLSVISIVLSVFVSFLYMKKEVYRYISKMYQPAV